MTASSEENWHSELSKAREEIIFLKRSLDECKKLLRSTERTIKSYLALGKTDGVMESIELKQRMIRMIERATNEIIEAKKSRDLWEAIEEVHTHAE